MLGGAGGGRGEWRLFHERLGGTFRDMAAEGTTRARFTQQFFGFGSYQERRRLLFWQLLYHTGGAKC